MNLAQLRTFTAVAETGRVTDAAARLSITQSAVSHALASLETELGLQLVVRDRTGSTLTDVGRTLLPHADAALRAVDRLVDEAAAATGLQRGRLLLGAFPTACQLLPPLIRAFGRTIPRSTDRLARGKRRRGQRLDRHPGCRPRRRHRAAP